MNSLILNNLINANGLLTSLSPEVVDYNKISEIEAIQAIVIENTPMCLKGMIEETRGIVSMEPFPWEWIQSIYQSLVYDSDKDQWVEDPLIYQKWLSNILSMLEKEANRQGKV